MLKVSITLFLYLFVCFTPARYFAWCFRSTWLNWQSFFVGGRFVGWNVFWDDNDELRSPLEGTYIFPQYKANYGFLWQVIAQLFQKNMKVMRPLEYQLVRLLASIKIEIWTLVMKWAIKCVVYITARGSKKDGKKSNLANIWIRPTESKVVNIGTYFLHIFLKIKTRRFCPKCLWFMIQKNTPTTAIALMQ